MAMAAASSPLRTSWPRPSPASGLAGDAGKRFVVCTGGEPLLQLDAALIDSLHRQNFFIAIETNGTVPVPEGIDWVCVSPKAGAPLVITRGDELKVVYPQAAGSQAADPGVYADLDFDHFFIQPKDGPDAKNSLNVSIRYCANHPKWRLSLQTHKLIGLR
jgi:7-carboxy-7-deazaguanine synthase